MRERANNKIARPTSLQASGQHVVPQKETRQSSAVLHSWRDVADEEVPSEIQESELLVLAEVRRDAPRQLVVSQVEAPELAVISPQQWRDDDMEVVVS